MKNEALDQLFAGWDHTDTTQALRMRNILNDGMFLTLLVLPFGIRSSFQYTMKVPFLRKEKYQLST